MLKLNNIYKSFEQKTVLHDVSCEVPTGSGFTIIGPSGCGKSTLLKVIIGLLKPDQGSILIDGFDCTQSSPEEWRKIRRKFGFVFQGAALFDSMNVYDNVAFGLRESAAYSSSYIERVVEEKLDWVGLRDAMWLMPSELSGGMRKRVGIARALAVEPEIILYDEPTTGLDPIVSRTIEELIVRLKTELKLTSIVVTHQISTIYRVSDQIVYMGDGRMIPVGTIDALRQGVIDPAVKNFIDAGMVL